MNKELQEIIKKYEQTKNLKYLEYFYNYISFLFYSNQIKNFIKCEKQIPKTYKEKYQKEKIDERKKMYSDFFSNQEKIFNIINKTLGLLPKQYIKTKDYFVNQRFYQVFEEFLKSTNEYLYEKYLELQNNNHIIYIKDKKIETSCSFPAPNDMPSGVIIKTVEQNKQLNIEIFSELIHELSHLYQYNLQESNHIITPSFDREVYSITEEINFEKFLQEQHIKNNNAIIRLNRYYDILRYCFDITKLILKNKVSINYEKETISCGAHQDISLDCYKYLISSYLAATINKEKDISKIISELNTKSLTELLNFINPEDYNNQIKTLIKRI